MEDRIFKKNTDLNEGLKNHLERTIRRLKRYFGKGPIAISFKAIAKNRKRVQIKIKKGRQVYFAAGNGPNYFIALNKARIQMKRKLKGKGERNEKSRVKIKKRRCLLPQAATNLLDQNDHYDGNFGEFNQAG